MAAGMITAGTITILAVFCFNTIYRKALKECTLHEAAAWIFKLEKQEVILTFLMLALGILSVYPVVKNELEFTRHIRMLFLADGLLLASFTDLKKRIIPNEIVLLLMSVGAATLIIDIIRYPELIRQLIPNALVGFAIGGGIMLVCMVITRGQGIGGGDVKLFSAMGFLLGGEYIFSAMFFSVLLSAAGGIVILIIRKGGWRQTIPMAPFIFAGTMIHWVFRYI